MYYTGKDKSHIRDSQTGLTKTGLQQFTAKEKNFFFKRITSKRDINSNTNSQGWDALTEMN